jgi:hypothetical protein
MRSYYYLFILLLGLFGGCGKDCTDPSNPQCPNYNPCLQTKEYTADFYCSGMLYLNQRLDTIPLEYRIQEDYVLGNGGGVFVSTQAGVKHYWRLGNREFRDSIFSLVFLQQDKGHKFDVMHVIEYPLTPEYKKCYPKATGRDTVIKSFTIESGRLIDMPIWGKYKGYVDIFPNREVTIEIVPKMIPQNFNPVDGDTTPIILVKNIAGDNKAEMEFFGGHNNYHSLKRVYCASGHPFIYINKENAIKFYMQYVDWNSNGDHRDDPRAGFFNGKRVN